MEEQLKKALEGIASIKAEFETAQKSLLEKVQQQDAEIKKHGGTATETSTAIKTSEEKMGKLAADFDGLSKQLAEIQKQMGRPDFEGGGGAEVKTIGQRFVESDAFKRYSEVASESAKGSDFLRMKHLFPRERKDIQGTVNMRTVLATQFLLDIFRDPIRSERVRDLFTVIPTTMGSIEYVTETGFTNAAAPVAEGAAKAESTITFDIAATNIKTIAHHVPVPRQVVADIPALQAYIDQRLIEGLKLKEDQQLLFGDGIGANLLGVLQAAGIQTYVAGAGESKIDSVRKAITKIRLAEYASSGIVLHPTDWEAIELAKDSQNRYLWVQVTVGGEMRLWRLPVVDTTAITAGTFATGAFKLAAAIWDREEAGIRVADMHSDDFTKNLLRVLAEERLGLTVYRPEAFCKGTFA